MKPKRKPRQSAKRTPARTHKNSSRARRLTRKRRRSAPKHVARPARARQKQRRPSPTKRGRGRRLRQTDRNETVRRMKVPAQKGMRGVAVLTRKGRSLIGRYWNAVYRYVAQGDASAL